MAGLASFLSGASGETSTNWEDLGAFYRNGVRGYFDVAAVHAFSYQVKDVIRTVAKFRAVMRRNGDRRKPIYATEVSWPALNPLLPSSRHLGFEVSHRGQRERLAAAYRRFATGPQSGRHPRVLELMELLVRDRLVQSGARPVRVRRPRAARLPAARLQADPLLKAYARAVRRY